jgi:SAM-dependent methyltransferase
MFNKKITRDRIKSFLTTYRTDSYTLDIGAGDGYYRDLFPNSVTVDADADRKPDIVADAHHLPFADETFDVVICTEVLEHLHTPEQAMSEFRRVLKPGGRLLLTTRFIFPLHDVPGDYYRYTKYGLRYLLREWKIEKLMEEASTIDTLRIIFQRLIFQTEFRPNKPIKLLIASAMQLVRVFSLFSMKEYGDIKRRTMETAILTSGYYVSATRD